MSKGMLPSWEHIGGINISEGFIDVDVSLGTWTDRVLAFIFVYAEPWVGYLVPLRFY